MTREGTRLVFAFLAAILAPACILSAWYLHGQFQSFDSADTHIWIRTRGFLVICLMISAAYVVALGIPAYVVLRSRNAVRWWSTVGTGVLLAVLPVAVLRWPPHFPGWMQYFSGIAFFGACGAVSAFAFWLVMRKVVAR